MGVRRRKKGLLEGRSPWEKGGRGFYFRVTSRICGLSPLKGLYCYGGVDVGNVDFAFMDGGKGLFHRRCAFFLAVDKVDL